MYVYEEMINGKKLTEIINETHENVKYLPGHKLPPNIVSKLAFAQIRTSDDFICFANVLGKVNNA